MPNHFRILLLECPSIRSGNDLVHDLTLPRYFREFRLRHGAGRSDGRMVEEAAAEQPDVILPFCTNLAATTFARGWEERYGIPVYDSIAMAARAGIELAGGSPAAIIGFGSVFDA